jgi:hypothetical protein
MPSELDKIAALLEEKNSFHPSGTKPDPEPPKAPVPATKADLDKLAKQLSQPQGNQQQTQLLQGILSNPQIAQILEAQQQGKKTKVVLEGEEPPAPPDPELNLDEVSPEVRKTFELLQRQQEKALKKMIQESLGPVTKKVDQVSGVIDQELNARTEKELIAFREANPEFDDYIVEMRNINIRTGGGLTPAQLLLLAKQESGHTKPKRDRSTESERPDGAVGSPAQRQVFEPGANGMAKAMDAAFNRVAGRLKVT